MRKRVQIETQQKKCYNVPDDGCLSNTKLPEKAVKKNERYK